MESGSACGPWPSNLRAMRIIHGCHGKITVFSRCTQVPRPVLKLLKVAGWAALAAAFWRTQCAGPGVRTAGSLAIGALIGLYGFRKGSLSASGARAGQLAP